MTEAQKGWIAGMLDGDGHLYIWRGTNGRCYSRVRVRITDEIAVKYLVKITGVGTVNASIPSQKRSDGSDKKTVHEWGVFRRPDTKDLLIAIKDYLVVKRKSAEILLRLEFLKDQGLHAGSDIERLKKELSAMAVH